MLSKRKLFDSDLKQDGSLRSTASIMLSFAPWFEVVSVSWKDLPSRRLESPSRSRFSALIDRRPKKSKLIEAIYCKYNLLMRCQERDKHHFFSYYCTNVYQQNALLGNREVQWDCILVGPSFHKHSFLPGPLDLLRHWSSMALFLLGH